MSDEPRKPEREVHFYVSAHLELPELQDFTVLETNRVTLTAVYWDTCHRDLLGWGHTVRHRTASDGSESGWTVKLGRDDANTAVIRDEIAFAGNPRQPPEEVYSLLRAFIRNKALEPIATIITDRRSQRLRRADEPGVVEVADDLVRSCVGGKEGPSFRELEVELIQGDEDLLVDVVAVMRDAGVGKPASASKLERVVGGRPRCELEPVKLKRRASVAELVSAAFSNSTRQLIFNDPSVRLGDSPEAVHDARVCTRRLRSDLKTLLPLLEESAVILLRDELQWLGGSLGAVRDTDVLAEGMCHLAKKLHSDDLPAIQSLIGQVQQERQERYATLRNNLNDARYIILLETLVRFASRAPLVLSAGAPSAAKRIGVKLARKAWKRVRKQVDGLGQDPQDADLHELRKRVKRARYAAELIDPLVQGDAREFAVRLADLQDLLGKLQDSVVADHWLRSRVASAVTSPESFAAGGLHAWELCQRAEACRRWRQAWNKGRRAKLRSWMD